MALLDGARRHERFGQVFLPTVQSRAWLAWCHAELGTFAEGRVLGDDGLRIAEAVAHPASLLMASWGIGLLACRQGDLHTALPQLERAIGLCQTADLPLYFPWIAPALGTAYTLGGRVANAVLLLRQAIEQMMAMDMLGMLYAKIGRQEPARMEISAAIALYRSMEMTFWLLAAERALAQVEGR